MNRFIILKIFKYDRSGQVWLNWIKYISWFFYCNEALMINQWSDVDNLPCENLDQGLPCFHNGDDVLKLLDFDKVKFFENKKKYKNFVLFIFRIISLVILF